MRKVLLAVTVSLLLLGSVHLFASGEAPDSAKWVAEFENKPLRTYPDLVESKWTLARPPYGEWDKIDLHRVVKKGMSTKGVVFIMPGTQNDATKHFRDDHNDPLASREEDCNPYTFFANRGYDVYDWSPRTRYIPWDATVDQLAVLADWGWDMWMGDMREAVLLIKQLSGFEKIWMGGHSFGGGAALNYASLYWKEDIKGIILLDGGNPKKAQTTNKYDLPAELAKMKAEKTWGNKNSNVLWVVKHADKDISGPVIDPLTGLLLEPQINPKTGKPWADYVEWFGATYDIGGHNFGPAVLKSPGVYGGFSDPRRIIHIKSSDEMWWPRRLSLESSAMSDWDNCPYTTWDFDEEFAEMDVPIIGVKSGTRGGSSRYVNGTKTKDFYQFMCPGFAHGDVYNGDYCGTAVSQRIYDWMEGLEK